MKNNRLLLMIFGYVLIASVDQQALVEVSKLNLYGSKSAITTEPEGGGRLGDQIFIYTAIKWFSLQYNIPVIYRQNPDLDYLVRDEKDIPYYVGIEKQFDSIQSITHGMHLNRNKSVLYQIPFRFALAHTLQLMTQAAQHKEFFTLIRSFMKPKQNIEKVVIPAGMISVAVHVRKGSGHDLQVAELQKKHPDKFLPDTYYQSQIRRISQYFNNQPLYVYLFSDCKDTIALKKQYERALSDKKNLIFDCNNNHGKRYGIKDMVGGVPGVHVNTIVHDLFSMIDFDCLVRSNSYFSRSVQLLGEHKIVVSPKRVYWDNRLRKVVVVGVDFLVKDSDGASV